LPTHLKTQWIQINSRIYARAAVPRFPRAQNSAQAAVKLWAPERFAPNAKHRFLQEANSAPTAAETWKRETALIAVSSLQQEQNSAPIAGKNYKRRLLNTFLHHYAKINP
jgi:hypothetical protein